MSTCPVSWRLEEDTFTFPIYLHGRVLGTSKISVSADRWPSEKVGRTCFQIRYCVTLSISENEGALNTEFASDSLGNRQPVAVVLRRRRYNSPSESERDKWWAFPAHVPFNSTACKGKAKVNQNTSKVPWITFTISKAPALTAREPRMVVCASGCISHTWPSHGCTL